MFEHFLCASPGDGCGNTIEPGLVDDDIQNPIELVEIQFLRNDADTGFYSIKFCIDAVAENPHLAGGLVDERGDDANRRRLARTIGSQQRKEIALRDFKIDPLQCLGTIFVDLREILDR